MWILSRSERFNGRLSWQRSQGVRSEVNGAKSARKAASACAVSAQGDDIYHNSFGGAYYGILINGPQFIIRNNVIDAGDAAVYGAGGAGIKCLGGFGPSTIEDNKITVPTSGQRIFLSTVALAVPVVLMVQ